MTSTKFIPLMVPDIQEKDIDAVVNVLRSGMLIQGIKVQELEQNIAKYLNVKHAIAVSNGTATMHLALVALGIGEGDEVIVPAFSYVASANVIELVGAKPVFIDIELSTFNIDVSQIEKAITPQTKAILPVHEFGLACDISAICAIAKKHGLYIIEDAACALGATENGKFVGTFGDIGSFSFHPRKAITSGEGGVIVTNNDSIASNLRILRNHGIDLSSGKMEFVKAGFNTRLTDFQAALVNSQLARLPQILAYKNELAKIYQNELKSHPNICLPHVSDSKQHTWQSFHVILSNGINRNEYIDIMKEQGIGVNLGAQCIPAQVYYRQKYALDSVKLFPNAWLAYTQGLVLPLYERLTAQSIKYISEILLKN